MLNNGSVELNIYPNPAKSFVKINSSEIINKLEIYDNAGKLKNTSKPEVSETKINVKNLVEGIYYAKIYTDKGTTSRKIVITK